MNLSSLAANLKLLIILREGSRLPPPKVKDMLKAMVTGIVGTRTRFSSSSYKLQPLSELAATAVIIKTTSHPSRRNNKKKSLYVSL